MVKLQEDQVNYRIKLEKLWNALLFLVGIYSFSYPARADYGMFTARSIYKSPFFYVY